MHINASQISVFTKIILIIVFTNFFILPKIFAATPVNPNAIPKAKIILSLLTDLSDKSGKKVISGHHVQDARMNQSYFQQYIGDLASQTGQWIGIIESSYVHRPTREVQNISEINSILTNYWNLGGLVSIYIPLGEPVSNVVLKDLYTPGKPGYDKFHSDLDQIASGLKELEKNGVVVLFRPFHEMNGGWTWYGFRQNKDQFIELWRHTFNYLTYKRHVNNILWVYAAAGVSDPRHGGYGDTVIARYPGNDYVDIVGYDEYTCNIVDFGGYADLIATGKPFAFTEFGPESDCKGSWDNQKLINTIKKDFPETVFFNQWSGSWAMINNLNSKGLLNDPSIINRDDLNVLLHLPLKPDGLVLNIKFD